MPRYSVSIRPTQDGINCGYRYQTIRVQANSPAAASTAALNQWQATQPPNTSCTVTRAEILNRATIHVTEENNQNNPDN